MTPDWNHNPGKAQSLSDLAGKQFQSLVPGGKNYRDFNLPDADKTPASLLQSGAVPPAPRQRPEGREIENHRRRRGHAPTMASAWREPPGCLDDVAIRKRYACPTW